MFVCLLFLLLICFSFKNKLARINVKLGKKNEGEKYYKQLFERNSNCDSYLQNIFKCNDINLGILLKFKILGLYYILIFIL